MKKNSIPKLELVFLLLLTGMCPQAHATDDGRNASPQKTYAVDLTLGSATVLTFTEAVTSQTGVLFSYESALSQMPLGDVSVHETAAPLEHILEKVFKGRGFRYKVVDRIVVLTYDTDSARSQLVLVTGRVKDGSGMPLVGASVVVKDTMRGVSAGAEGNYRIFADPDATLVFSYIGYADREERIGTRSAIDVVLEEYEAVLEDVVVVGYGTQSRRTVTAAISKFDGHLLEGIPVNSVGDALKGRVPGVRVATTDATPGADPKFLIRGGSSINQSNDPIVLVDGVVREMAGLNPNDIESVSFLKDAAAAGIYGSRASNGVILITTKKGSKHLGPRIVFEGQWAWASPATKFDLMNARDYILTVRPALMEGYCGGMDPASVLGGEQSAGTGNTAKSLWTTRYLRPDEPVPAGYQWVEDPVNPGRIIVFEDNDQQSQWFGDACWQNYYVGIDGNAVRGTVADHHADARIGEPFSKPRGTQRTRPHARIAGENHLADMCREVLRGLYGGRPALRGGDCACRHILRGGGTPDEGRRHEQRHRRGDQHSGQHDEGLAFGSHGQHRNDAAGRSRRHQSGPGKRKEQQPGGTARNRGEDQRRARQDIGKIDFVDTAAELDDYGAGRRLAHIAAAEKPAGQQYAQPGAWIRFQQEHDRLPGFAGLLDADRREDAVVQGIIEEQHLGRLDQKRHERQQSVADHDLHAVADQQRQPRHRTADDPIAQYGQQHTEDAYREIAHEHLEARLYASLRKFVEPPDRIPAQRAHDHGSDEHRDIAADDDAHGGNGPDYPAAFAGDVAPGRIGDQQRQQVGQHRVDQACHLGVGPPSRGDEERRDESPRDERADVGHDHAAQGPAEFLYLLSHSFLSCI